MEQAYLFDSRWVFTLWTRPEKFPYVYAITCHLCGKENQFGTAAVRRIWQDAHEKRCWR